MAKHIGSFFAALAGAMSLMQVTVAGVEAQGNVIVRKSVAQGRDTLRVVSPVNEDIVVFGFLMQMGQISAELEKIQRLFEREMPGNQSVTITRNMSATLQGLQQNAQDRLFQLKVMCSAPATRAAWLGIAVSEWKYASLSYVQTPLPYPLVSDVEPRSPAAAAGLEPGDEIRQVDGVDLRGRQLAEFVKVPGKKLNLTIKRHGEEQTVHAVLDSGRARVPEACEAATSSPTVRILIQRDSTLAHMVRMNPMDVRETHWFTGEIKVPPGGTSVVASDPGVFVMMNSGLISNYAAEPFFGAFLSSAHVSRAANAAGAKPGVRVLHVILHSRADSSGLKREDVVRSVNKKAVTNLAEFKQAVMTGDKLNRTRFDLEVIRDEKIIPVVIPR